MPVEYVASANSGPTDNDSSQTVTVPAAVQSGDVAVLFADRWNSSASLPATTGPAGAVERFTSPIASGSDNNVQTSVYLLRLSGESSLAVSWSGYYWSTLGALFFTGVDPAVDLASVPLDSAPAAGAATAPDVSVTVSAGSALAFDFNGEGDPTPDAYTPPTGYTLGAVMDSQACSYAIATSGGTKTVTGATVDPAQGALIATLVALPPEGGGGGPIAYTAAAEPFAAEVELGTVSAALAARAAVSPLQVAASGDMAVARAARRGFAQPLTMSAYIDDVVLAAEQGRELQAAAEPFSLAVDLAAADSGATYASHAEPFTYDVALSDARTNAEYLRRAEPATLAVCLTCDEPTARADRETATGPLQVGVAFGPVTTTSVVVRDITVNAGPVTTGWATGEPAGGWSAPEVGATVWSAEAPIG